MTEHNTKLWDAVCKTDPAHTKKFKKGGGFSGTAIKPFYLMRKATEIFGPCGLGWGWKELENKMVGGVWCSKVELWYIINDQRGTIEQWGQTGMITTRKEKNEKGDYTGEIVEFVDEEAPKKAITDAVTKCLSYLGFAGDVHMGRFDDSKYVEQRVEEEKQESSAAHQRRMKAFLDGVVASDSPSNYLAANVDAVDEYLDFPEKEMVKFNLGEKIYNVVAMLIESSDDPAEVWHKEGYAVNWCKQHSKKHYDDLIVVAKARKTELEAK